MPSTSARAQSKIVRDKRFFYIFSLISFNIGQTEMKALDLAAYIVNLCIEEGNPVSNLQLQKIMYITHLYYFRNHKAKLITDLPFEAWRLGAIIERVYYKYFYIYAANPIINKEELDPNVEQKIKNLNLDQVIINLSNYNFYELVKYVCEKEGAWDKTYQNGLGNREIISDKLIEETALS